MAVRICCAILTSLLMFSSFAKAETEAEARKSISENVRKAFAAEDFSTLEKSANEFRTSSARTSSGLWKLTVFYASLLAAADSTCHGNEKAYSTLEQRVRRWIAKYPRSSTPHIFLSQLLTAHGWAIRGCGFANEVKPEAWAPFHHYLKLARKNMEEQRQFRNSDPEWYATMIYIATGDDWSRTEFSKLMDEALDKWPGYYDIYFNGMNYLLPMWNGSAAEVERFANEAVERTKDIEGQSMYARIYWYASQRQFDNDLFNKSHVQWPKMKAGFDDVILRYPDGWNLNNYAKFACLAQDRATTASLVARIGLNVQLEAWDSSLLFAQCSRWASGPQTHT